MEIKLATFGLAIVFLTGCSHSSNKDSEEKWIHPEHELYQKTSVDHEVWYKLYSDWLNPKATENTKHKELRETLDWIKGKLESERQTSASAIGPTRIVTYEFGYEPTDPCSCLFIENIEPHIFDEEVPLGRDLQFFNLSNISGVSYQLNNNESYTLTLSTYNSEYTVESYFMDGLKGHNNFLQIVCSSTDPEKFVEAFEDAMKLCGSKKEKY